MYSNKRRSSFGRKSARQRFVGWIRYNWYVPVGVLVLMLTLLLGIGIGRLTAPKSQGSVTVAATATLPPLTIPTRRATPTAVVQQVVATATRMPTSTRVNTPTATPTSTSTVTPESPTIDSPIDEYNWVNIITYVLIPEEGSIQISGHWRKPLFNDVTKPEPGDGVFHTWYFRVSAGTLDEKQAMLASLDAYLSQRVGQDVIIGYSPDVRLPVFSVNVFQDDYWSNGGEALN